MRLLSAAIAALCIGNAAALELTSPDVHENQPLIQAQVYKGLGCRGGNLSPALAWSDVPAGTRSFAITVYDADALAGSGWWHWVIYDIPADVTQLPAGISAKSALAKQLRNDFAEKGFGGACPPAKDPPHRYVFTVYALSVERLDVVDNAGAAIVAAKLREAALAQASITARHARGP